MEQAVVSTNSGAGFRIGRWLLGLDAAMARGFRHHAEHLVVQGGHAEPLDEFPKMEAFLQSRFKQACR